MHAAHGRQPGLHSEKWAGPRGPRDEGRSSREGEIMETEQNSSPDRSRSDENPKQSREIREESAPINPNWLQLEESREEKEKKNSAHGEGGGPVIKIGWTKCKCSGMAKLVLREGPCRCGHQTAGRQSKKSPRSKAKRSRQMNK